MSNYANPEVLVSTDWVADNLKNPDVALIEVNVDTTLYDCMHIPGAIGWSWKTQLCNTVERDILSREAMQRLMSESGVRQDATVVLYGDSNNWFAAWAFWQLAMYGHSDLRIMDGGRKKWEAERRAMVLDRPVLQRTDYRAEPADNTIRALLSDVQQSLANGVELVDVRSMQEFTGEVLAPPGLPETCQRGGHIPGARNVPWAMAVNDDGTFKTADELRAIYGAQGITGDKPVIAYCRIGERSSHTWFVLRYLIGVKDVRNYDGSWTEWGNLVGAPVAVGSH